MKPSVELTCYCKSKLECEEDCPGLVVNVFPVEGLLCHVVSFSACDMGKMVFRYVIQYIKFLVEQHIYNILNSDMTTAIIFLLRREFGTL